MRIRRRFGSSSTSSTRAIGGLRLERDRRWEGEGEPYSPCGVRGEPHVSAVPPRDPARDREAEPGASRTGRDEGLEEARDGLGGDSRPVVLHLEKHGIRPVPADEGDVAAEAGRLDAVEDEVQER